MANLDESYGILSLTQGFHNSINAISGKAEYDFHAPILKLLYQHVRGGFCHVLSSSLVFSSLKHASVPRRWNTLRMVRIGDGRQESILGLSGIQPGVLHHNRHIGLEQACEICIPRYGFRVL